MNVSFNPPNFGRALNPQTNWPLDALPSAGLADPSASRSARTRLILLADDDPGVSEMLGRLLELEHYTVIRAKTGNETGAKFIASQPDLLLLDLNMPERDGWSAFRFIHAAQPTLPVIVITARPGQYAQAIELGIDAFMEKPLNLPLLLDAIKSLLSESDDARARRRVGPARTAFLDQAVYETKNPHC